MSKAFGLHPFPIKCLGEITNRFYQGINTVADKLDYADAGYPIIQAKHITGNYLDLTDLRYVSEQDFLNYQSKYRPAKGDLLLSNIGTIGKSCLVKQEVNFLIAWNVFLISLNKNSEPAFVNFLLEQLDQSNFYDDLVTGNATKFINKSTLGSIEVPHPPHAEQQKIAAILTSVDDVIESTQAQINKLKDLKTGMMQELLIKGIGHTEFKDSPAGMIPKAWATKKIQDLASYITSGSRGWAEYYSDKGAIFIRIGNLTRENINFRFNDIVYVNPPEGGEGKRTLVQVGDVLISITADLGIVGVVNESIGEAYVNQHVSLVRLNDIKKSRWVGHYLSHENAQKQFTANNDSGAKAGLNLTSIRNLDVALPPDDEMDKIVNSLDSIDTDIVKRKEKLVRFMELKKALMQDLLTGKVRVKVN